MSMGYVAAVGGGMLLASQMGSGGGGVSADPAVGQAAQYNAQVAADTLAWYKEKDAADKPNRDKAIQIALDQAQIQTDTARKQNAMADETYAYTKDTFRPLEQKIAADALGYDTQARRDSEAAQAQADIGSAGDATRATLAREVASRGGDVNSGNFTASLANAGVREAAVKAGAGNAARKNVEAIGAAKLADAANLGRGIASTNATQTQLGLNAGNSAVANAQVPGNISAQQTAGMNQTASTAIQGTNSAGSLSLGQYNGVNSANAANNASNNAAMGQLGQMAGTAAMMYFSDEDMKEGKEQVSGEISLAAIRKIPVSKWKYKKGSKGDDGGRSHTGPMAQDVQKQLGEKSAPGGKMIDPISLSGHTIGAIKALDKRLVRLEDAKRRK